MEIRYRVVERIGAGGMGVVYRVEDLVLRRSVALKVLSGRHLENPQARARFLRESRIAASLNHPNICTIHEVGEIQEGESPIEGVEDLSAGTPYIVMELVEGRTLDRLMAKRGGLPVTELLRIAVQVAEAMAEAHAKGIVHRDLKPENVVVGPQGRVKVLDFGLAKPLTPPEEGDPVLTDAARASVELTLEGMVLGTVAYMSPEQAQGKPVDSRSDVFAFGILLYEMATRQRAFPGDSAATVMAKILESEPEPVSSMRPELPAELGRIVRRCLRKAPEERYNDTRDLVVALKDLRQDTTSEQVRAVAPPLARRSRLVVWAGVGAVLIAAAVIVLLATREGSGVTAPSPMHTQVTFTGQASRPDISPDGKFVAYSVWDPEEDCDRLLVQDLAGGSPLEVFQAWHLYGFRWSPDGERLVCGAVDKRYGPESRTSLLIVPRMGGTPERLGYYHFAVWSPDGATLAATSYGSRTIKLLERASGREWKFRVQDPASAIRDMDWCPRADLIAYVTIDERGRYAIWVTSVDGQRQTLVLEEDGAIASARWSQRENALYYLCVRGAARELFKVPIQPSSGERSGEALSVIALPEAERSFSLSADGRHLFYASGTSTSNLWLASIPRDGEAGNSKWDQLTTGTYVDRSPRFSPSGDALAFSRGVGRKRNLFLLALPTGAVRQLTFTESLDDSPVWSPDGRQIAFVSQRFGEARIWTTSKVGAAPALIESGEVCLKPYSLDWARTGTILFLPPRIRDIHLLDPSGGTERSLLDGLKATEYVERGERRPFAKRGLTMFCPRFSPDGQSVALQWTKGTRTLGVWTLPVTEGVPARLHPEWGPWPIGWSPDGAFVYVVVWHERPRRVVRIRVTSGEIETVCELPFDEINEREGHVSPDGGKVVLTVPRTESDIWLVENFDPEVE